ncbi:cytochrome b N-terminal domain-containing protein [Vulgatibacter sp.]|uniref:cytochrome b N-terminal domain-containing protein n=1 Tax=Vulgatibacter sp. TaxID=1971226 RepID=UPI003561FD9C
MKPIEFLEERTGLPSALRRFTEEPPRLSALGGVLVALFLVQFATGFALSLHYAPTATDAWGSVWYVQNRLALGALIRSLHHWGTSAIVVAMGLHLLLTALAGSYRRPNEVRWWLSVAALFVVLGSAMTGNPLPWDQDGYWGARVESGIMASMPVVGPVLHAAFLGGNDLGNLTLTRFYALHAVALPALLLGIGALQWHLAGRNRQAFTRDPLPLALLGAAAAVGGLVVLSIVLPVELGAPAEPASSYQATPAWYFVPLNQLVALFPASLALLGTAVIPGVAVLFLLALPFLDRGSATAQAWAPRLPWLSCMGAGGLGLIGLLAMGLRHEAVDETLIAAQAAAAEDAARATLIAEAGLPPEGAAVMLARDPLTAGKRIYAQQCAPCHLVGGAGTDEPNGPDLAGYLSAPWLRALVEHPRDPRFFGTTEIDEMDPYAEEDPEQLALVVAFLQGLRAHPGVDPDELPASLAAGRAAWDEMGCESCHEITPGVEGAAPNLAGYGSDAWLRAFLRDPGSDLFYGEGNEMPSFEPHELSDEGIEAVITWLRRLEQRELAPPPAQVAAHEPTDPT